MTTRTSTGPTLHTSDADFRTVVSEFIADVIAAGLVQTADTGQINPATVTRPGVSGVGGYAIFYLNDSLHATKPCYIKFEFGTGGSASQPNFWVQCGTGTNGSGTISGEMLARTSMFFTSTPTAGNYPTFACSKEGYFAIAMRRRGYASGGGGPFFSVCRTVDASGTPTTTGFYFYVTSSSWAVNRWTYLTSSVSDTTAHSFYPGGAAATLLPSGDVQLARHFGFQPTIRCVPFFLNFMTAEIGDESTFSATPIGVTSRTYLALGGTGAPSGSGNTGSGTPKLAMQYD